MKPLMYFALFLLSSSGLHASNLKMEQYERGHIGINITVNDKVTYPFIIDTGAQGSIIPTELLALLEINLEELSEMRVRGAVGEKSVKQISLKSMTIGQHKIANIDGIVTDLPMWSKSGKRPGILPFTVLNRFVPEFNFENNTFALHSKSTYKQELNLTSFSKIAIELMHGSFIKIPLQINGKQVRATLDSGAAHRIDLNWHAANEIGIQKDNKELFKGAPIRGAGGQILETLAYSDIAISINDISFNNHPVTISDMPILRFMHGDVPAANIGIGIFSGRRVLIDYQNKALWVSKLTS